MKSLALLSSIALVTVTGAEAPARQHPPNVPARTIRSTNASRSWSDTLAADSITKLLAAVDTTSMRKAAQVAFIEHVATLLDSAGPAALNARTHVHERLATYYASEAGDSVADRFTSADSAMMVHLNAVRA